MTDMPKDVRDYIEYSLDDDMEDASFTNDVAEDERLTGIYKQFHIWLDSQPGSPEPDWSTAHDKAKARGLSIAQSGIRLAFQAEISHNRAQVDMLQLLSDRMLDNGESPPAELNRQIGHLHRTAIELRTAESAIAERLRIVYQTKGKEHDPVPVA